MSPSRPSTYKIVHLDGVFSRMSKNGETLPVKANSPEHAVTVVFGAPADANSWDGLKFTKWDGTYRGKVVELS